MKKRLTANLLRHTVYYVKSNSYLSPPLLVLSSLADGDKHGYAMMEDIERFAGVRLGAGTLYGAITRLEQRGWIRPVDPVDRRQPYTITGAGREYLRDQLAELERLVRTGQRRLKHT
jgi:DNA-binding PadR family transcriptional regulator